MPIQSPADNPIIISFLPLLVAGLPTPRYMVSESKYVVVEMIVKCNGRDSDNCIVTRAYRTAAAALHFKTPKCTYIGIKSTHEKPVARHHHRQLFANQACNLIIGDWIMSGMECP